MLQKCDFHHIGVAVLDIEKSRDYYVVAGYEVSKVVVEPIQKVKVAYATRLGFPTIELLEALDGNSPVCAVLKQRGVGPYHICYAVPDIYEAIEDMKKYKYLSLAKPVPGHGLDDALTVFMYHKEVGLIQLVEIKNS